MAPERVAIARAKPIDERLANVAKRLRVGGRLLAMDTVPLLDVAVEGGAFERTELASSRDAVSWTDAPVPLYLYTKVGDTWKCPRCTFANPLYDDFTFVTECALCPDELRAKFGLGAGDVDSHRPKRAAAARMLSCPLDRSRMQNPANTGSRDTKRTNVLRGQFKNAHSKRYTTDAKRRRSCSCQPLLVPHISKITRQLSGRDAQA